jgi:hypothetical protein
VRGGNRGEDLRLLEPPPPKGTAAWKRRAKNVSWKNDVANLTPPPPPAACQSHQSKSQSFHRYLIHLIGASPECSPVLACTERSYYVNEVANTGVAGMGQLLSCGGAKLDKTASCYVYATQLPPRVYRLPQDTCGSGLPLKLIRY